MTASVIGALRINLGLNSAEFERGMDQAGRRAKGSGDMIALAMRGAALGGIALVTAEAAKLTLEMGRLGAAFDDSMRKLAAAADVGADALGAVSSQMREIGLATGEGAAGTARVAKELMKAGVSMKDATGEATRQVILLAQANEAQLPESVDIAAGAMLLFGKRGDQMGEVAKAVTAFVSGTRREVIDFAGALGMGGQAAATAGVSLEEFTGALVASVNAFSSGSDQGTAFKTFIQRLTPTSAEAAAAMAKLGFSAYDANGQMKPLQQIVDELADAMAKLETQQLRNEARVAIFGTDAERMAAALITNRDVMRQVTNETIRNTDVAGKAAMANSGYEGSTKRLNAAIEELAVTIGEAGLTDAMIGSTDALAEMVKWMAQATKHSADLREAERKRYLLMRAMEAQKNGLPTVDVGADLGKFHPQMSDAALAKTPWGQSVSAALRDMGFGAGPSAKSGPPGGGGAGGGSGPTFSSADRAGYFDTQLMRDQATLDYEQAMERVSDTVTHTTEQMKEWGEILNQSLPDVNDYKLSWQDIADSTADALNSFSGMLGAINRKDWLGALAQGIQLISRISDMSKAGGFGGGFGGVMKGIGKLMGFANGGSFEVAGASGVDRNLVAFRATAGERVTVTKPGQSAGGGSMIYAPQIDARGADAGAVARIEAALKADAETRRQQFVAMYRDARARGKI